MCRHQNKSRTPRSRRGLTFVELMLAAAVMGLIVVSLGALATTVQLGNEFTMAQGAATQHGRVALERMQRAMNEAPASIDFPGFAVFSETVGAYDFPDTLVVWRPDGDPANAAGPPLFSELVIFCPDADNPGKLVEITVPTDNRPTPDLSAASTWTSELSAIKLSPLAEIVTLTDLLRSSSVSSDANIARRRGVLRFETEMRPSASAWSRYEDGTTDWEDIAWPQGLYGSTTGVRVSRCNIEFQLMPPGASSGSTDAEQLAIPFFGSAAVYHQLPR
jgi:hypothetical protein